MLRLGNVIEMGYPLFSQTGSLCFLRRKKTQKTGSPLPECFLRGERGRGEGVNDFFIPHLEKNKENFKKECTQKNMCMTEDPHPYPSPLAKSTPGEGILFF